MTPDKSKRISEVLILQQKVAKKMMAAIALLLVSTLMLGTVTYAWISISAAPEVREIKANVAGNGYLEIALQSGENTITGYVRNTIPSYNRNVDYGQSVELSNSTWGNIISMDNSAYGLDFVKLYPSRLNLTESYAVSSESFLLVPTYGTDGRMASMEKTQRVYYNGSSFTQGMNLGVSVHGDTNSMGDVGVRQVRKYYDRERFVVMMSEQLANERQQVYNNFATLLEETRRDDLIMLLDYIAKNNSSVSDQEAYDAACRFFDGIADINQQALALTRYALIAKAAADTARFNPDDDDDMQELSELYSNFGTWTLDSIKTIAQSYRYSDIVTTCNQLNSINRKINDAKTQLTPTSVSNSMSGIINVDTNTWIQKQNGDWVGGTTVNRALALRNVINDGNGDVWLGNGILFRLAGVLGDLEVRLVKDDFNIGLHICGKNAERVQTIDGRQCDPSANKGIIYRLVSNILTYINDEEDDYGQIYATVTEYDTVNAYGYSIDMAFRSNEPGSLILQQKGKNRISGETAEETEEDTGSGVQGGGSFMSFTFAGDLNRTQVTSLMQSIYVVFMNQYNRIVAVASAGTVTVKNRTATADLVLYNYNTNDGILRTTSKKSEQDQTITDITANTPLYITAIVYLSGDSASSGVISATQAMSLSGTVNLQFAHSETLKPANYDLAE